MKKILFGTSNKHKFEEAKVLFRQYDIIVEQYVPRTPEIQNDNLENIAKYTVLHEIQNINKPLFVEDAGIFIEELNGFPGPYSSYVQKTIGNIGILKLMEGVRNRDAEFRSVVAYCEPNTKPATFMGITKGYIAMEIRGGRMFGYDPIFIPYEGDGRAYSEMAPAEKNKISHRGKALILFINRLKDRM